MRANEWPHSGGERALGGVVVTSIRASVGIDASSTRSAPYPPNRNDKEKGFGDPASAEARTQDGGETPGAGVPPI